MAALSLLVSGASAFAAVITSDLDAVVGIAGVLVGASAVVVGVLRGEIDLGHDSGAAIKSPRESFHARPETNLLQQAVDTAHEDHGSRQLTLPLPPRPPVEVNEPNRVASAKTLIALCLTSAMPLVEGKLDCDPIRRAVQMFIVAAVDWNRL